MKMHSSLAALLILVVSSMALHVNASWADTINVPADQPTIQVGITAANPGDTVLVAPGTYTENIDFFGKDITVTSSGGADVTVIDGGQAGSVATFASGETVAAVLEGFTLRNGSSFFDGGGVAVRNSSPTIRNNLIIDNFGCDGIGVLLNFSSAVVEKNVIDHNVRNGCSGGNGGGGILVLGVGNAEILDNVISNNVITSGNGGGMTLFAAGTPTIRGNLIAGNSASGVSPAAEGGGIWIVNFSDATIVQNVIVGNTSDQGGGVSWLVPGGELGPIVVNNTIAGNTATLDGSQIFADGFDAQTLLVNNIIIGPAGGTAVVCGDFNDINPPVFQFNDVFSPAGPAYGGICNDVTGSDGNISADPLFVNAAAGDYHVDAGSPAIDAGDNNAPELPTTDFDGNPRIFDVDADGQAAVDMGAFERQSAPPASPEELLRTLIGAVIALDLPHSQENLLVRPPEQALGKLMDANFKNDRAAVHRLQTFVKKVEGFHRRNILNDVQAGALVAVANEIIALLANA